MASAPLDALPDWALDLLASERIAHLGLLDDDGRPRVLPIVFAIAAGAVWSAVDYKPKRVPGHELARVRWLRARPQAAITADRYDDDWHRLAWVQLLGRVDVLARPSPPASTALRAKYRQYAERPPRGPFLKLTVERALCWRADEHARREDEHARREDEHAGREDEHARREG